MTGFGESVFARRRIRARRLMLIAMIVLVVPGMGGSPRYERRRWGETPRLPPARQLPRSGAGPAKPPRTTVAGPFIWKDSAVPAIRGGRGWTYG